MDYDLAILSDLASYFDHTLLKPQATETDIKRICDEANQYNFYAVCVGPCFARLVKKLLLNRKTKLCTVIGFPLGANVDEIKLLEARQALEDGADELDMVMNIGYFLSHHDDYVGQEIAMIHELCLERGAILKVIIETALLTADQIERATKIVFNAGAEFIKTSTGFSQGGATLEDVRILRRIANQYNRRVKAAGGIRDLGAAYRMIIEGADRIGSSSSVQIMDEAKIYGR